MNLDRHRPAVMLAMSELFTLLGPEQERRHLEFARIAEAEGIDGLFVSEHVVMGSGAGALGRPTNPREFVVPGMQDPATPWQSPLVKLGALAAVTERIRIMACAVIAPLRHPLLLAKEIATLTQYAPGRVTVLPTVSWHAEEYAALGVPFTERGRRLDEQLAIWERLRQEQPASFQGDFWSFEDVWFSPRPGAFDLWFGGELRPATLRRIARYGQGMFLGRGLNEERRELLITALAGEGRRIEELEVAGWMVPRFDSADAPADLEATIERTVPWLLDRWTDTIAIKPSHYIDDPDDFAELCRRIRRGLDRLG